ncbi:MAG: response regulator [Phenylobacterium sp.]
MTAKETPPRLLIVDDVEENRDILKRRFARLGYATAEAKDGETALEMIEAEAWDCVLLDVMMPGIDGLEVLRRVRETRSETELPVIMVTAKSASEDVVEALLMGANDYVTKPVDMEVAGARVEMQLRRKRAEDHSRAAYRELEHTLLGLKGAVVQAQNKSAVLADLGPEARAPLTGILGASSVLTRVCDTPDLKQMIGVIETASAALDKLVIEAARPGGHDRRKAADVALGGRISVLSADSDPKRRTIVRMVFAEAAVEIELVEAHGGADAAAACANTPFDLILMNVDMADGLAGVKEIRRREAERRARRTPVLALSKDAKAAQAAAEAGCDLHMPMPITAAGLLTSLARALSRESQDLSAVA